MDPSVVRHGTGASGLAALAGRLPIPSLLGLPSACVVGGAAAGAVLAATFVLSPSSVCFAFAASGLVAWSGRGLAGRERRMVLWIVGVALALRAAAIGALFLYSLASYVRELDKVMVTPWPGWGELNGPLTSFPFDGDGTYMKRRSLWMRSLWLELPIAPMALHGAFDARYAWSSYLYLLGFLQYLIGPAPYGVHLLNAVLFVAGAVLLHKALRATYGRLSALVGLALVLFVPTLFLWSISALKESFQFFLAAAALAGVMSAARASSWRRFGKRAAASLVAVAAFGTVRAGALATCGVGIVAGVAAGLLARRVRMFVGVFVIVSVAGILLLRQPHIMEKLLQPIRYAAVVHKGHVQTPGHGYKLLDQRLYFKDEVRQMNFEEVLRFAVRASVSILVLPLPWQAQSRSELAYLPQQMLWYTLLGLAVLGLPIAFRRDPVATGLLAGYAIAAGAVVAISSGNIGSMVRHRDTVTPFLIWISAVGGFQLFGVRSRQPETIPQTAAGETGAHASG